MMASASTPAPAPAPARPFNVQTIFDDYRARRTGIVRTLTDDVEKFYDLFDPEEDDLCLFGNPNGSWDVKPPPKLVPPGIPEPTIAINLARDELDERALLDLVAAHSDSWLLSLAFYYGGTLSHPERSHLFNMINDLPTVLEAVNYKSQVASGSKSQGTKRTRNRVAKRSTSRFSTDEDDESVTKCGSCDGLYSDDQFWIACDVCDRWFHGKCVNITPRKANTIDSYKCPSCDRPGGLAIAATTGSSLQLTSHT